MRVAFVVYGLSRAFFQLVKLCLFNVCLSYMIFAPSLVRMIDIRDEAMPDLPKDQFYANDGKNRSVFVVFLLA